MLFLLAVCIRMHAAFNHVLWVARVASKLYSLLELNDCPAHSRGGLVTFCLDTKSNQKNQDRKKLPRCRPDSLARFSVMPLPAFVFSSVFAMQLKSIVQVLKNIRTE
jgi:hypothetical protein